MYVKLIPTDWYFQSPIDFEHKQYVLFAYLQEVDTLYLEKKVSPHLLHLEKLEKELLSFKTTVKDMQSDLNKQKYVYFQEKVPVVYPDELLLEISDIVEFSIPQIASRIQTGYRIAARYKQLLY